MSKKTKLTDNKMVRLVARLFKKESLSFSEDGKVELTDDEEAKIKATYGENFLKLFKESDFSADENATKLFDAAVKFQTEKALSEVGDKISESDKAQVEADMAEVKAILERTKDQEMSDSDIDELKAAKEKLTNSAQALFTKMYENMQQAQGGAGPDMGGFNGAGPDMGAGADAADDVVDGDYREV